jgi:hypothetical protein
MIDSIVVTHKHTKIACLLLRWQIEIKAPNSIKQKVPKINSANLTFQNENFIKFKTNVNVNRSIQYSVSYGMKYNVKLRKTERITKDTQRCFDNGVINTDCRS